MVEVMELAELLKSKTPKKVVDKLSFEEGVALLDQLVSGVESGTLSLDDAIQSYEKGVMLLAHLKGQLTKGEQKLQELTLDTNEDSEK